MPCISQEHWYLLTDITAKQVEDGLVTITPTYTYKSQTSECDLTLPAARAGVQTLPLPAAPEPTGAKAAPEPTGAKATPEPTGAKAAPARDEVAA